jgi:hypothetical protein
MGRQQILAGFVNIAINPLNCKARLKSEIIITFSSPGVVKNKYGKKK